MQVQSQQRLNFFAHLTSLFSVGKSMKVFGDSLLITLAIGFTSSICENGLIVDLVGLVIVLVVVVVVVVVVVGGLINSR